MGWRENFMENQQFPHPTKYTTTQRGQGGATVKGFQCTQHCSIGSVTLPTIHTLSKASKEAYGWWSSHSPKV